jgi:DHA1 family tetracycline resistance protein-like MFS transporter
MSSLAEQSQRRRKAAFIFIFATVLLDMLALGVIIPVLPTLVLQFVGGDNTSAAEIYGLFSTVWSLMQFLFSPLQGALSDRFGRRPIVLLSNFGLCFDYVLMALAPSLFWLFAGRVLSGVTAASIATANAYIADVTPPEKRAGAFGMMGVAFSVGFILGPALGGVLAGYDLRLPFWVAAGLSLLNGLYGLIMLPESLPKESRSKWDWSRTNPIGSLKLLRSHARLFGFAMVSLLSDFAHSALPTVMVLYIGYRYGWDASMIGLTMAIVGVSTLIVQGGLIRPFVERFGERAALFTGFAFGTAGFAAIGLAPTGSWLWFGIALLSMWGLAGAAIMALMSKLVSPTEQGQLQGANASLMGIASMLGPVIFTLSYATAINPKYGFDLPGVPFLIGALFLLAALIVSWRIVPRDQAGA